MHPIHAWLDQSRPLDNLIDPVMIVSAQNDREVKLPARLVILGNVQMLEGKDDVASHLLLQETLVFAQGVPRTLDFGPAESAGLHEMRIQLGIVAQDADKADGPPVSAVRGDNGHNLVRHLMVHGFVRLHVCVDPRSRKVLDVLTNLPVVNIGLMIAPYQHVNGRRRQGIHHPSSPVDARQQVGAQEVSGEHGDDGIGRGLAGSDGLEHRFQAWEIVESVHVRYLHDGETSLVRLGGCQPRLLAADVGIGAGVGAGYRPILDEGRLVGLVRTSPAAPRAALWASLLLLLRFRSVLLLLQCSKEIAEATERM